jgi:hypothetical protein
MDFVAAVLGARERSFVQTVRVWARRRRLERRVVTLMRELGDAAARH